MTKTNLVALDLFAGTGWGVACKALGIQELGVEIMPAAISSREAAGFDTVFEDVWDGLDNPSIVPDHNLLIASPRARRSAWPARVGAGRHLRRYSSS